jgi:hypothetical protein
MLVTSLMCQQSMTFSLLKLFLYSYRSWAALCPIGLVQVWCNAVRPFQPCPYLTVLRSDSYFQVGFRHHAFKRHHLSDMRSAYCLNLSSSLRTTMFASKNRSTHCLIQGSSYLSSLPFLTLPPGMHLRKQVSVRECIAAMSHQPRISDSAHVLLEFDVHD